jgi:hypothetical protein
MNFHGFSPPAVLDFVPQMSASHQFLSPEEFDSLTNAVQLLRISQLRYIVQRFSLPASGNKSKLLSLVLSIFPSLRYDRVLIDIHNEVTRLLAQQGDSFTNPLAPVGQLEIVDLDPSFSSPQNPLIIEHPAAFIFGPIFVPVGHFAGRFQFGCPRQQHSVSVSFLFSRGIVDRFGLKIELNGFPFEISQDDPYPQPLDITHVLNFDSAQNILEVKLVTAQSPMMIVIREYDFVGIHHWVNQIAGRPVDITTQAVMVRSPACDHPEAFDLVAFLSLGVATGSMSCPICHRQIDIASLTLAPEEATSGAHRPIELFQPSMGELFAPQLDWFDF